MLVVELSVTIILNAVVDVTVAVKVPLTVRFGTVKRFVDGLNVRLVDETGVTPLPLTAVKIGLKSTLAEEVVIVKPAAVVAFEQVPLIVPLTERLGTAKVSVPALYEKTESTFTGESPIPETKVG